MAKNLKLLLIVVIMIFITTLSYSQVNCTDPVVINSVSTNGDPNSSCVINYGPYCPQYYPFLEFHPPDGSSGININGVNFSSAGGNVSVSVSNYITAADLFRPMAFRINKKLGDGTIIYGNYSEELYFYDNMTMDIPNKMVCEDKTIDIQCSYTSSKFASANPEAIVEAKIFGGWSKIDKLLGKNISLTYKDIFKNFPYFYGEEFRIRAYKIIDYINRDTIFANNDRYGIPVVFLPTIKNISISSTAPTCAGGDNGFFTLTFNDIPTVGSKKLDGTDIPLIITIKQYSEEPLSYDPSRYIPITNFPPKTYYFLNGATMINNYNLLGKNWITINNELINSLTPNSGFKLESGIYDITVNLNNGIAACTANTIPKEFTAPLPFRSTASAIQIYNANGNIYHVKTHDNNAKVKFTFSGGTEPYIIKLGSDTIKKLIKSDLDATNSFIMDVTTTMAKGVTNETITYRLADKWNCQGSKDEPVTFYRPNDISFSNPSSTQVNCNKSDASGTKYNGTISVQVSGGVANYISTLWKNGVQTTHSPVVNAGDVQFTGTSSNPITAGTYKIKVTDALNPDVILDSTEITVGEPTALSLSVTPTPPTCDYLDNGTLTINPTGGTSPYSYAVTKGASSIARGANDPENTYKQLSDGNYSITVTDDNGCTKSTTETLTDPLALSLNVTYSQPASCAEVKNAKAVVELQNFRATNPATEITFWNGSEPLNIESSNYTTNPATLVLSGLAPTTNSTYTVHDAHCEASSTVFIPIRTPQFTIQPSVDVAAPCTGKNAKITINASNNEGTVTSFKIDGNSAPSNVFSIPGKTKHSFSAFDGTCTATITNFTVPVSVDSLRLASVPETNITPAWCTTSNTGAFTINKVINTGVGVLTFTLIGESQSKIDPSTATFSNLLPKTYTIVATDDSLCTDTTQVIVPVRNDSLNIKAINSIRAACEGNSPSGEIKVSRYTNDQKTGFGNITYTLGSKSQNDTIFKDRISGHYIINAVDEKNCPASASVDVEFDSNPVTLTIDSVFDQTCNQVANARIYLKAHTATVGTEQTFKFTYNGKTTDWNKDTVSYKLNTAGDYSFSATDMNNCGTTLAHTIDNLKQAPKPKLELMSPTACASANNGALTITNTPHFSLAKYRYTLETQTKYASSSNEEITFPNLTKGYYIITARDTLGCQDTTRFYVGVEADSVHVSSIRTVLSSCIASENGVAVIKASSADATKIADKYTFRIVGQSLSNENIDFTKKGDSATFTNLPVNKAMYAITVTDRFGCINNESTFAIKALENVLDLERRSVVNSSCIENNDGIISFRRKYGDEKFRFEVTSPYFNKAFYTTDTLVKVTDLPDGIYNILVRDTSNCSASIEDVVITEPQEIQFASVYNNYIQKKGEPEGILEAKVWKGNDKYNYEWFTKTGNNWTSIEKGQAYSASAIRLTSLTAGDYMLRVQDTAACKVGTAEFLERYFTLIEPEKELTLAIKSLRNASCFGSSDGEFVLEASGGWGNQYKYGFDANADHMDIINCFTGRKKESINMFAADTSGFTVSIPVTIDEPAMLTASLSSQQDVNCYGEANGSATLNITGGNHPYYYISSNNLNWEKGYTKHNLPVGRSTLYIRDTLNCAPSTPVEVDLSGPAQIVETSQITRSLCGFNNGRIVSAISGGKAPYSYQWYQDNLLLPIQTNRADSLFSGSYRLVVTDDFACSREFTFPVSDITDLSIDNIITTPVTCWGYTDGKASIHISKGNPEYIITWPDKSGGYSVSGLKEGTYTVGVTDQEKCKVFRDFTIGTPVQIYLAENRIANPLCEGREDGSIDITAAGDFTGFDYTWSTGRKGNTIRSLAPGTYTVTVADDHNCSNTFNFDLQYQNFIKPSLGNDLTLCKGNSVQLKAGAFSTYNWGSTTGLKSSEPNITVSEPASYSVEVKDDAGCIGRDTINIAESATEMTGKLLIATYIAQHDTVMIFEASWPLPDSVKFELEGCKVLQTGKYFREVIFADTGTYKIGLVSYLNDCSDQIEKVVVVEPRAASALKSAQNRMIKSFKASPNPNNGLFDVELLLRESAAARLRLINISTGITTDVREYKGSDLYTIHYNLNLTPGMYLLHIQVGSEAQTKTLVIQ